MIRLMLAAVFALSIFSPARADELSLQVIKKSWELNRHVPRNEKPVSVEEHMLRMCDSMRAFDKMLDTCAREAHTVGDTAFFIDQLIGQMSAAVRAGNSTLEHSLLLQINAQIDLYTNGFDEWYMRHFPKMEDIIRLQNQLPELESVSPDGRKT